MNVEKKVLRDFFDRHKEMLDELATDPRFLASEFWKDINDKNIDMLIESGLENFKRTVAQNYFNWLITDWHNPQFLHLLFDWVSHPRTSPLLTRIETPLSLRLTTAPAPVELTSWQLGVYRLFVAMIWQKMLRLDAHNLCGSVSEPEIGNPIRIWQGSTLISQDLANSILECNTIIDSIGPVSNRVRVAELGAGYGRLAHVFSATQTGTYFIFDVPPALCVADWYLTRLFPSKRIFRFRNFSHFADVRDEVESCDIVMMTANQLTRIPPGYFDVVVSISSLPEMTREQADMYLRIFQAVSRNAIFLKQWKQWRNPHDGTDLRAEDYALGAGWVLSLDRTDPINPRFFNRVWKRQR